MIRTLGPVNEGVQAPPGLRLLVVDDDDGIRTMLAAYMRQRGWTVDETDSADGARRCIAKTRYDLILLDQYLPDGSGMTIAEEQLHDDCGVILMTAYASVESAVRGVRAHIADYLTKPFPSLDFVHSRLLKIAEVQHLRRDRIRLLETLQAQKSQLEVLVVRDPLTGLYNHGFLQEALAREITRSTRHLLEVSLLALGVDDLTRINDTHGPHIGDKLLNKIARLLAGDGPFKLRQTDIAARYGGSEFAVILPHTSKRGAAAKAEALRAEIAANSFKDLGIEDATISVGIATYPEDANDREALLHGARAALATAKRSGPNQICVFSRDMEAPDQPELGVMERHAALLESIKRRAFNFHYQPIRHAGDGGIYGYEALVRPTHPALPNPAALFSTAEGSGMITELGRVVRGAALATIRDLPYGCSLFVNLHPYELTDHALIAVDGDVEAQRERIVFEITEGSALDDSARVARRIDELRSRGYRVAIDDLGSGYAGLLALSRLSPDFVKLDRPLVHRAQEDQRTARLVRHIIEFANGEGIAVVAEGIETREQRDRLQDLGCTFLQGFFLGAPGPLTPN